METTDNNKIIDSFYDAINSRSPFESLPVCLDLYNKINSDYKNNSKDQLSIELRNLYIFCLNEVNKISYQLKYNQELNVSCREVNNRIKLGFSIMSNKVKEDYMSKEFLAYNMVLDLLNGTFPNYDINIEDEIHKKFHTKDKLQKYGINKAIIEIVNNYDCFLGDFISTNLNVLKKLKKRIKEIEDNYDVFEEEKEKNKYKIMIDDINDFCDSKGMNKEETLLRLAAEYHILNKIIKYSDDYQEKDYFAIKDIVISASRNEIDFNYEYLRKLVERYLKERFVTKKLSVEIFKEKVDYFVSNFDDMTVKEQLTRSKDILDLIKSDDDYDYLIDYICTNYNKKVDNILKFINKKKD